MNERWLEEISLVLAIDRNTVWTIFEFSAAFLEWKLQSLAKVLGTLIQ